MDGTMIATPDPVSGLDPPFGGARERLTTNPAARWDHSWASIKYMSTVQRSMCTPIAAHR